MSSQKADRFLTFELGDRKALLRRAAAPDIEAGIGKFQTARPRRKCQMQWCSTIRL